MALLTEMSSFFRHDLPASAGTVVNTFTFSYIIFIFSSGKDKAKHILQSTFVSN